MQIIINNHLSDETLHALCKNELSITEQMHALEHVSKCNDCALRFAAIMESTPIKAPSNLKSQIIHEAHALPTPLQAKRYFTSKRAQLLLYSTKVVAAVACSLLLLGIAGTHMDRVSDLNDTTTEWVQSLSNVTTQLVHYEPAEKSNF